MSRDLAASVRAKLLNIAKAERSDFNQVLIRYALERFLYRLGQSQIADHLITQDLTQLPQSRLLFLGFPQQLLPIIGRSARRQHFAKYPVGIVITFISTFVLLIINPSINNDATFPMVAEKQAVLLEELGTKPVGMIGPERVPLSIFCTTGILRNDGKHQVINRSQALTGVFALPVQRFSFPQGCYLLDQALQLIQKQRVRIQGPAIAK
ncbi:MAG: hypothetical protein RL748_753 [Pseudomonadota bacterium]|jgi:hypothetical protein